MSDTVPVTGYRSIDEAVAPVTGLDETPLEDHPAIFESAHAALREALVDAATLVHDPASTA